MTITKRRWTSQEIETVKELSLRNFSNKEIALRINRSERSVQHTKTKFNIQTQEFIDFIWSKDETIKLSELRHQGYSDGKLAKIFNRSISAIKSKLSRDGIKSPRQSKIWTEQENKALKEMIDNGFTKREISAKLNKSLHAVRTRAIMLKFKSKNAPIKWSEEELNQFKDYLSSGIKIEQISLKMNRGCHGLISKAKQSGWRRKYSQINEFLRNHDYCQDETINAIFRRKIIQLRNSAKSRNIFFDLSEKELGESWEKQKGLCGYSGNLMTYINGMPNTFSVDRIDSEKGYIKDNIILCLSHINMFKGDMHKSEFLELCKSVALYNHLI